MNFTGITSKILFFIGLGTVIHWGIRSLDEKMNPPVQLKSSAQSYSSTRLNSKPLQPLIPNDRRASVAPILPGLKAGIEAPQMLAPPANGIAAAIDPGTQTENPEANAAEGATLNEVDPEFVGGPLPWVEGGDVRNIQREMGFQNRDPDSQMDPMANYLGPALVPFINKPNGNNGPTVGVSGSGGFGSVPPSPPAAPSFSLNNAQVALVNSTVFNPQFIVTNIPVNGQSCVQGGGECQPLTASVPVSTQRWDLNHGVKLSGIQFLVEPTTSDAPVQFRLRFRVQDASLSEASETEIDLPLVPATATSLQQSVAGQDFQVLRFTFPNTTSFGATLSGLQLQLVYPANTAGSGPVALATAEGLYSSFSLIRSNFATSALPWGPGSAATPLSEPEIRPDQLATSINL